MDSNTCYTHPANFSDPAHCRYFRVLFWNLHFFVPALLGAYTLYVLLLRSSLFLMTERWKWPRKVAAAALLLLSFISILLPIQWMFVMLQGRVITLFQNADQLSQMRRHLSEPSNNQVRNLLAHPENIGQSRNLDRRCGAGFGRGYREWAWAVIGNLFHPLVYADRG